MSHLTSGGVMFKQQFWILLVVVLGVQVANAHIRILQTESVAGARERYTMRVPNEKQVDSYRIEGEFPAGLKVYAFEPKPGWSLELKKNKDGNIVGAVWTGVMRPYEFQEFGMLAINPASASAMTWKFVQYYADGNKEEFTGPVGSRLPAPVTQLKPAVAP
jgi:uncharacterized protein YcnI